MRFNYEILEVLFLVLVGLSNDFPDARVYIESMGCSGISLGFSKRTTLQTLQNPEFK